ncbi:MAG: GAF domain-containing sensor histidine kinase [Patescibacteria group bacterium]
MDKNRQLATIKIAVNDAARLIAVKETQLLNTDPEESFDRLTKLASKLLKTPISFVTLLEANRDFVKSHFGLPEPIATQREITAHPSFCQHIVSHREPLILEDARKSALFKDFPSVLNMGVRAYAGIPLITVEGQALGTCCVVDFKPRKWKKDEIEILKELAKSVMTEINLKQIAYKLKKENEYKDEFINIASHELKTPLTSLKLYTQRLQRKFIKNEQLENVEDIDKVVKQLARLDILVTDLLDLTRIQGDKLSLNKTKFDLNLLVEEIIESLQQTTHHKILYQSTLKKYIRADRERIGQVITNLVSNAVKYSPKADKVVIKLVENNNNAQINIQDFGIGILPKNITKLFERFYRVTGSKESKYSGLGLGLYISSEIINSHHGRIWVDSVYGQGSTFNITLPLQ